MKIYTTGAEQWVIELPNGMKITGLKNYLETYKRLKALKDAEKDLI